jgi:ribosome-associated heat shock protein Hsp15
LVYARFVKHRSLAAELVEAGHVRLNRVRLTKPSHVVKPQDVLTIALHNQVRVVRVLAETERRGPACEAKLLYEEINAEVSPQKVGALDQSLSYLSSQQSK